MKKVICFACMIALLLSACSVPKPQIEQPHYTHAVYELTFETKMISGSSPKEGWIFTYTYNGEAITSGHQIVYSLEFFTFLTIEVQLWEDSNLDHTGNGTLKVAICNGGSGKTKITVADNGGISDGDTVVWEIVCTVKMIRKQ